MLANVGGDNHQKISVSKCKIGSLRKGSWHCDLLALKKAVKLSADHQQTYSQYFLNAVDL
jgi:hypothetical protein